MDAILDLVHHQTSFREPQILHRLGPGALPRSMTAQRGERNPSLPPVSPSALGRSLLQANIHCIRSKLDTLSTKKDLPHGTGYSFACLQSSSANQSACLVLRSYIKRRAPPFISMPQRRFSDYSS